MIKDQLLSILDFIPWKMSYKSRNIQETWKIENRSCSKSESCLELDVDDTRLNKKRSSYA